MADDHWAEFSQKKFRKQTISLHIGQCGLQIGKSIWELFASESNIELNGEADLSNDDCIDCDPFFEERSNSFRPRALFVDFDQDSVANIRKGGSFHI